jgi:hypothetical protein
MVLPGDFPLSGMFPEVSLFVGVVSDTAKKNLIAPLRSSFLPLKVTLESDHRKRQLAQRIPREWR